MSNEGTTLTFHFPGGLTAAERKIMARAMAELIRLHPDEATWRFATESSPEQAYELGVETGESLKQANERHHT